MAKRRPSYLIMVSGPRGLEIFSAHYTEADAVAMHDRLGTMLAKTAGSAVHLVKVPSVDGLVPSDQAACRKIEPKPVASPVVVAAAPAAPNVSLSQEAFEEQTRQMLKGNGERDGFRDDRYTGAFS